MQIHRINRQLMAQQERASAVLLTVKLISLAKIPKAESRKTADLIIDKCYALFLTNYLSNIEFIGITSNWRKARFRWRDIDRAVSEDTRGRLARNADQCEKSFSNNQTGDFRGRKKIYKKALI